MVYPTFLRGLTYLPSENLIDTPAQTINSRGGAEVSRVGSYLTQAAGLQTNHSRGVDPPGAMRLDLGIRCAVDL